MSKKDYYETLGLSRDASDADLKKAYRKLARQYHPDVNKEPGAEEMFKDLSEAYAVLSDPQQRAAYDRFGHAGLGAQGGYQGGFEGFGGLGDIFEAFFGRGRDPFQSQRPGGSRSRAERGADLRLDLDVDFREAIFGVEREISIQHQEPCGPCQGSGLEPGTSVTSCPMCRGSGQIQQHQRTAFGTFTHITTCPKCQGKGNCQQGETCLTHHLWQDLSEQIHDFLGSISLSDLIARSEIKRIAQQQDQRHEMLTPSELDGARIAATFLQ